MLELDKQNRIELFDIAKGIAIIAVVLGHIKTTTFIHRYIYLWHMLFFFVLAGYFFKEKYYSSISNLSEFIKNKFIRLMIPYICFNILFEILHNFFINIHFYTTDKNFNCVKSIMHYYTNIQEPVIRFFTTLEPLVDPSWFLYVLFCALVLYAVINFLCKKIKYNYKLNLILFLLSFLLLGYHLGSIKYKFLYIGTISSTLTALFIGTLFQKINIKAIFNKYYFILTSIILIIFTIILPCNINISVSQYYNPALYILLSIVGFIFVMSFASLIKSQLMAKICSYIGQNTIPILLLHYVSFKLITYTQIIFYQESINNLAVLGTFHSDGLWWLLYLTAGIVLPIIANIVYKRITMYAKILVSRVLQGCRFK